MVHMIFSDIILWHLQLLAHMLYWSGVTKIVRDLYWFSLTVVFQHITSIHIVRELRLHLVTSAIWWES